MKGLRPVRLCFALALFSAFIAVPASADPGSDLFALFFQVNNVANNNGFTQGERVSLGTKVIAAINSLDRDHEKTAANNLGAFQNEVAALERSGRLAPEDAQALTDAADAIVTQLSD